MGLMWRERPNREYVFNVGEKKDIQITRFVDILLLMVIFGTSYMIGQADSQAASKANALMCSDAFQTLLLQQGFSCTPIIDDGAMSWKCKKLGSDIPSNPNLASMNNFSWVVK